VPTNRTDKIFALLRACNPIAATAQHKLASTFPKARGKARLQVLALGGLLLSAAAMAQADAKSEALASFRYPEWTCDGHRNLVGRPASDAERVAMQQRVQAFKACTDAWSKAMTAAENRLWTIPAFNAMSTEAKKAWKATTNKTQVTRRWYEKTRDFSMAEALALEYWAQLPTSDGLSKPDFDRELTKVAIYFQYDCPVVRFPAGEPTLQERERIIEATGAMEKCHAQNETKWATFRVHEVMSEGRWNLMSEQQRTRYHSFIRQRRRMSAHLQNSDRDFVRQQLAAMGIHR
jgi:hypothetical protein